MEVTVIGAGLAGSEAALQLAKRNINVKLYEMRPKKSTGAHVTDKFAEFVCSNSLGAADCTNASGLLKKEMQILGGELINIAFEHSVPAGGALAIDREKFSEVVTDKIKSNKNITVITDEITEIPKDGVVIVASGPLTSPELANSIKNFTQSEHLHFFDAIAPIVEVESINFDKAFYASRYDKGEASYINCPMNKEEYEKFYNILINAPKIELKDFEKGAKFFESCLPIEVLASRGVDTLRFGPMKPVGLVDKRTGEKNYEANFVSRNIKFGEDTEQRYDAIIKSAEYKTAFNDYLYFNRYDINTHGLKINFFNIHDKIYNKRKLPRNNSGDNLKKNNKNMIVNIPLEKTKVKR